MKKKTTISVKINGEIYTFPHGSSLEFILDNTPQGDIPIVSAMVNGFMQDLSYTIIANSEISWIDLTYQKGIKIYRRSLRSLLMAAHEEVFPDRNLIIQHTLEQGLYCESNGKKLLTKQDIEAIEIEMKSLVAKQIPINQKSIYREDAIKFYTQQNHHIKADMLKDSTRQIVHFFELNKTIECVFSTIVSNTKYLNLFELIPYDNGFIVRSPNIKNPNELGNYKPLTKLGTIFNRYGRWATGLGLEQVGYLNKAIRDGRSKEVIAIAETMQDQELYQIAKGIIEKIDDIKMILISGPSSSGKTTFSQKLATYLLINGIKPVTIGMDNYFLNRHDTPKDANGEYDFECIEALDVQLFNEHIHNLILGKTVDTPVYDFVKGVRSHVTKPMELKARQVMIIEGIHGLNDSLTASVPRDNKAMIYISALTQLKIDEYTPISSSDNRLIRRMARDMATRGTSPTETIMRWESVQRGEEHNIFPYQENADFYFNSALVYELACLKPIVSEELHKIPTTHQAYYEAQRLLVLLEYILPIDSSLVPNVSLIREFIGNSYYEL